MFQSFDDLPETSRIWVYLADRRFEQDECQRIEQMGFDFVEKWESHGNQVPSNIHVLHHQFIVICADDCGERLCGRAGDAQLHWIQNVEKMIGVCLTNRMLVAFRNQSNDIETLDLNAFKTLDYLTENTIVFNNLITTKKEFLTTWQTTIQNSWHKQVL